MSMESRSRHVGESDPFFTGVAFKNMRVQDDNRVYHEQPVIRSEKKVEVVIERERKGIRHSGGGTGTSDEQFAGRSNPNGATGRG